MNNDFNSFPLYTTLKSKLNTAGNINTLSETEIKEFMEYFKKMDTIGYERFFVLIRYYQMDQNELTSFTLPYGARKLKKGIRFDLKQIPPQLQHILHEFLKLHSKTLK